LIGHKFSVQDVSIAVEPDISDNVPGLLLGAHFDGDIIGITTIKGDIPV